MISKYFLTRNLIYECPQTISQFFFEISLQPTLANLSKKLTIEWCNVVLVYSVLEQWIKLIKCKLQTFIEIWFGYAAIREDITETIATNDRQQICERKNLQKYPAEHRDYKKVIKIVFEVFSVLIFINQLMDSWSGCQSLVKVNIINEFIEEMQVCLSYEKLTSRVKRFWVNFPIWFE